MTFPVIVAVAVAIYFLLRNDGERNNSEVTPMPLKQISPTSKILNMAKSIANAEGFGIPDAIPTRANNPGDLVIPGWTGETLGAEKISVFSSVEEGWQRLYNQLNLIVTGRSRVYTLDMSIAQMEKKYAPHAAGTWARNVARGLGVDPDTSLREVLT
jgi:hypothetical protein